MSKGFFVMTKKILLSAVILSGLTTFSLILYVLNSPVDRVDVSGFEKEEQSLLEKYPPSKALTLEELNLMDAEVEALISKKIERLKQQKGQ